MVQLTREIHANKIVQTWSPHGVCLAPEEHITTSSRSAIRRTSRSAALDFAADVRTAGRPINPTGKVLIPSSVFIWNQFTPFASFLILFRWNHV